ncbi:hypothetical protein J5N97_021967 [Dioscorea zingiberensis]|uniref:non-specific serine/threonine protein kinase n=1 Tax=Dioscorea zingiberensis TaxID=325984 RepID=A0A9D5HAF2_9LILI|nr:hypothetical protein J5N97_021967 [Dioscorea zingiberensis]
MSCFSCFGPRNAESRISRIEDSGASRTHAQRLPVDTENVNGVGGGRANGDGAQSFTFRDLAIATQNFREENQIGQGGFGKVFKGRISTGQAVAIKQLNREGMQGSKEFLVEVLLLIVLRHPNLVNLIGYCAEGDERLLVYDFGMLLLELITGRKAFDSSKTGAEQKLINWSRPYLTDRRRFNRLADPLLQGRYPQRAFHQLVVITSMCLQELPHVRPIIRDVVVALNHVAAQPYVQDARSPPPPSSPSMTTTRRSPPPLSPLRRSPRTPSRR